MVSDCLLSENIAKYHPTVLLLRVQKRRIRYQQKFAGSLHLFSINIFLLTMSFPTTSIIGLGALGGTLARAFFTNNIPVKSVFNRNENALFDWAENNGLITAAQQPRHKDQLGEITFITVPDDAIVDVVEQLQQLSDDFSHSCFVHCSGNESANILKPLQKKGACVASMHPLQTFNQDSGVEAFSEIYFSLQGDTELLTVLMKIAKKLGANTIKINSRQKAHLHAAAVIASNYLMTLIDDAVQITSMANIDERQVKKMLQPLVTKSIKNITGETFEQVLSGPIARADTGTIKKHLKLLREDAELKKSYIQLGLRTVDKAQQVKRLSPSEANRLRMLLNEDH